MKHAEEIRPDPVALLKSLSSEGRRRALFRVHVGYARCAGATSAMLDEARRRTGRGTDVVVAAYRVHGDPERALEGLNVLGRRRPLRRSQPLNVQAVLDRNPEVVCIDDLAAVDGEGRPVLEAVPEFLARGIQVLATLHVLSLASTAASLRGMLGEEEAGGLLDDAVLERIDEMEIVDITPEDLLRRIREQHLLTPAELAIGRQRELRPQVLELLRETGLRLIAEHTDRQLSGYLGHPPTPLEFRGRIVLCLPASRGLEDRIRAAAAYASAQDAKLTVVTVRRSASSDDEKTISGAYAALAHQLGGQFIRLRGGGVAETIAGYVRETEATEVILGHRRRRWTPWDTTSELVRKLAGVDVHVLRSAQPRSASEPQKRAL